MTKKKTVFYQMFLPAFCLLFYVFLFFLDGVKLSADSLSYVDFSYSREPLYPLFLTFFRRLFGINLYLNIVVFVQCLLWAFAMYRLTMELKNKIHCNFFTTYLIAFFQVVVVLLCRLVATRRATYCNEICSEALAIPLFTLLLTELFAYTTDRKNSHLIGSMILAALLISTRKQMYMVVLIMGALYFFLCVACKINVKKMLLAWGSVILAFLLSVGLDVLYNYSLRGTAMRHTSDSSAMVITLFYSSGREDAQYFEDEDLRKLFTEIMTEAEEKGYTYKAAEENWLSRYNHYSDHYDLLAFGIVNPAFYSYIDEHFAYEKEERELAFDEINSAMISALMSHRLPKVLQVAGDNMLVGLCNTISKAHPLLVWYNVVFGVVYMVLMIFMGRKKKQTVFWLAFLVLLSTLINVVVVGVLIFAQTRYMIYNMPFVYIAMYLMLREMYGILRDRRKRREHA